MSYKIYMNSRNKGKIAKIIIENEQYRSALTTIFSICNLSLDGMTESKENTLKEIRNITESTLKGD